MEIERLQRPEVAGGREDRKSQIKRGLGLDLYFIARWVSIHENACVCDPPPDPEKDEVWWYGLCVKCNGRAVDALDGHQISHILGHGESKAAITMKYAYQEGYAEKIKGERLMFKPTEKSRELFDPAEAHVMPAAEKIAVGEHGEGEFTPLHGPDMAEAFKQTGAQLPGPPEREALPSGEEIPECNYPGCAISRRHYHRDTPDGEEVVYPDHPELEP